MPQFCRSKTLDHNRPTGKREGPARLALQNTIELVCGISAVARADARRRAKQYNETLGCVSIYARRCRVACQCERSHPRSTGLCRIETNTRPRLEDRESFVDPVQSGGDKDSVSGETFRIKTTMNCRGKDIVYIV